MRIFLFWLFIAAVVISAENRPVSGQVTNLLAKTSTGLIISVRCSPKAGLRPVEIMYSISNRSSRPIYHVTREVVGVDRAEDERIIVNDLSLGFSEHGPLDYVFTRIRSGQSLNGSFKIDAKYLQTDGFNNLILNFGFIGDIAGLRPKNNVTKADPAAFRGLVADRVSQIRVGDLGPFPKL